MARDSILLSELRRSYARLEAVNDSLNRRFAELAERALRIGDHNDRLERRNRRLQRENDELVVHNRHLIDENTRLRTDNNETRDRVEAEIALKIQTALDKSKSEDDVADGSSAA